MDALEIRVNNLADREARDAAENGSERVLVLRKIEEERLEVPCFSEAEEEVLRKIGEKKDESGKWDLSNGRQLLNNT